LLLDGLGIDSQIVNTGSITINGAYVSADGLGGLAPQTAGVLNVTGGTLVNQGMITINAAQYNESGHGAAGGLLEINTEAGVMLNSGLITVDAQYGGVGGPAGTLAIGGYVASTGIINVESSAYAGGAGGVLYVAPGTSSHFDIQGSVNLVGYGVNPGGGGTAVFAGTVDIAPVAGAAAAAGVSVGNGAGPNLPGAGSLTISGYTLLASTNSYIYLLGVQGGLLGGVPGSLTITDAGTLGIAGGFIFGNGFLTNQGYLDSVGGGKITVDEFRNDGLVTSDFGTLAIMAGANAGNYGGSAIQGTGQFSITAGGTLSFYVGVGSGQTVTCAAAPGAPDTLALKTSGDFGGVLSGLNDSSVIDLLGQDVTGVTTSGDLLTVFEPGATYRFSLAAPLPAGTGFSLNPDGNGGTDIGILTPGGVIAEHGPGHAGGADPSLSFTGHLTA
jgi:filamentous hemagglutinin